ncbi:unnamed protein product [Cylindrotheca closterium]|uniref:T9SS-like galactose binding domain-containing protein n=1 Tax=Cylindrotheca closterium TaxID=2856 RepID=A0AAD2CIE7_9STRA|nr:unnamed protein product [Cylindrotheca closterium]
MKRRSAIAVIAAVAILALIIGLSIHFSQNGDSEDIPYSLCYFDEASRTYKGVDADSAFHDTASPCVGDRFVDTSVFTNLDDLEGVDEEETYSSNYFVSFLKAGIVGLAASEDIIKNVTCIDDAIEIVFSMPVDSERIQSMFPESSVMAVDGIVFGNCSTVTEDNSLGTPTMPSGFLLVHSANLTNIDTVKVLGEGVSINYLFQERNIVYEPYGITEGGERRKLKKQSKLDKFLRNFAVLGVTFSLEVDPTVVFEAKVLKDYWQLLGEKWYEYDPYIDFELRVQYELGLKLRAKASVAAGVQLQDGVEIPMVGFIPIPSFGFKLPRLVAKILKKWLPKQEISRSLGLGFEMPFSASVAYSAEVGASVSSGLDLSSGEKIYRWALKGKPPFISPTFETVSNVQASATQITPVYEKRDGKFQMSVKVGGKPSMILDVFVPALTLEIPAFKICGDFEEELTCGDKCCESEDATCTIADDGKGSCDEQSSSPTIPELTSSWPSTFPPTADLFKTARDPHFKTWNGRFSYQGACDLVYVDTDLMTVHVRTTLSDTRHFSYISAVAVSIGGDLFEFHADGTYFVNKEKPIDLPGEVGGYPLVETSGKIAIDLSNGQFLRLSTFSSTITVDIRGNADDFSDSRGIIGSFQEDMAVRRDGSLFDGNNVEEIASEWLVDSSVGDELLFVEGPPHEGCMEATPFTSSDAQEVVAQQACSRFQGGAFDDCVFDVLASDGDTEWARNPGFNLVQETLVETLENDRCDSATVIPFPYIVTDSTIGALPDDVRFVHCGRSYPSTNGIWYSFTKDTSGLVRAQIDTESSSYPLLRVYRGKCDSLVCIIEASRFRELDVIWPAEAGVTYQLLVSHSRFGKEIDSFSLSIQDYEVPENDTCDLAAPMSLPYSTTASTVGALPDYEVDSSSSSQSRIPPNGIWYSFTGNANAMVRVQIDAEADVNLRVYRGECNNSLTLVHHGYTSRGIFDEFWITEAGVKYQLLFSGRRFGVGIESFSMSVQQYEVPENDACDSATIVSSFPYSNTNASTLGALPDSRDNNERFCAFSYPNVANGIWYSLTKDTSAIVRVQIDAGVDDEPHLRVFSGECDSLGCVKDGFDNNFGNVDRAWFAEAGVKYQLLISERFYRVGIESFSLSIQDYEVPENDVCDSATIVSLPYNNANASSVGALPDSDDTVRSCGATSNDPHTTNGIWYSFTAETSAIVGALVDAGSSNDLLLRVYSGECDSLVCVGSQLKYSGKAEVVWFAEVGVKYQIFVSGYSFHLGIGLQSFSLSIQEYEVPENGACDLGTTISLPFTAETSSIGALPDHPDDPNCLDFNSIPNGIWYSHTKDTAAIVRAQMNVGVSIDTRLRVYTGECGSLDCVVTAGRSGVAEVFFFAEAGVKYHFSFSETTFGLGIESFSLTIEDYEVPENDTCNSATRISLPYNGEGSTLGALPDPDDTSCATSSTTPNGIWYTFTASTSGNVRARIDAASRYNTLLRVYSGDCESLVCLSVRRSPGASVYRGDVDVTWFAEAGVKYQLLVSEQWFDELGIDTFSIAIDFQ